MQCRAGSTRAVVNGKDVLHAARCNYLGLSGSPKINKVGEEAMRKYGVGSCGPRGFYGTIGKAVYVGMVDPVGQPVIAGFGSRIRYDPLIAPFIVDYITQRLVGLEPLQIVIK